MEVTRLPDSVTTGELLAGVETVKVSPLGVVTV
jgi:hypothetical protein